jgi:hypothetical protein
MLASRFLHRGVAALGEKALFSTNKLMNKDGGSLFSFPVKVVLVTRVAMPNAGDDESDYYNGLVPESTIVENAWLPWENCSVHLKESLEKSPSEWWEDGPLKVTATVFDGDDLLLRTEHEDEDVIDGNHDEWVRRVVNEEIAREEGRAVYVTIFDADYPKFESDPMCQLDHYANKSDLSEYWPYFNGDDIHFYDQLSAWHLLHELRGNEETNKKPAGTIDIAYEILLVDNAEEDEPPEFSKKEN